MAVWFGLGLDWRLAHVEVERGKRKVKGPQVACRAKVDVDVWVEPRSLAVQSHWADWQHFLSNCPIINLQIPELQSKQPEAIQGSKVSTDHLFPQPD